MAEFQNESIVIEKDTDGSYVLILDVPGRAVNVLTPSVLTDLNSACAYLEQQPRVPVLIVRSGKKTGFLAGADINEFATIKEASAARALSENGQTVFRRLANLPTPSVVVLHGPCLGGGLELALWCDYRLVYDNPSTQLGLPEVELGLLPGWGGTQLLPKIVGVERAFTLILTGRRLSAMEAFREGLADAYAASEAELREAFAKLKFTAVGKGKVKRDVLPIRTWRQRLLEWTALGRRALFKGVQKQLQSRVADDMPAPMEAFEAVRIGIDRGLDVGLQQEREAAARLALSPACRNLVGLFQAREAMRKLPSDYAKVEIKRVQRVGVVGAGVMGSGIAQLAALSGMQVVVQESSPEALAAGMGRIDELFQKAVQNRKLTPEDAAKKRQAVKGTTSWEGYGQLDLVIESAVEDLTLKQNLFREILSRISANCVPVTNTSSLALRTIQAGVSNSERLAGLHFFNPVYRMPLIEVVRTEKTTAEVIGLLMRFAIDLGKSPVLVSDGPGFIVNRILMPYIDEGVRLVAEGLGIGDIDRQMKRFGMPMGPLELLDQIGIDVAVHVGGLMRQQIGDGGESNAIFKAMQQKDWLGQKTGVGFYLHRGKSVKPHSFAQDLLRDVLGSTTASKGPKLPMEARLIEARERLVLMMVNEAAKAVERKSGDAETVDRAMVFGTGWAPHRGGPLRYADERGLMNVLRTLEAMCVRWGVRYTPCMEIKRRAGANERFRG